MNLAKETTPKAKRETLAGATLSVIALALFMGACGTEQQSDSPSLPDGVIGLAPADWSEYRVIDVQRVLDGDPREDYTDSFQETWDDLLYDIGVLMDEVAVLVTARNGNSTLTLLQGDFDFEAIRDELSDSDMEQDDYRSYELWEGNGSPTGPEISLIEDGGFILLGDVTAVLRGLSREVGLLRHQDESGVLELLGGVGDGWHREVWTGEDCLNIGVRRCEGAAWSVASTGRGSEVQLTWAFAFRDERSANRELDNVEDLFDDIDVLDVVDPGFEDRVIVVTGILEEHDRLQDGREWASVNFAQSSVPTVPAASPAMPAPQPALTAAPAMPASLPAWPAPAAAPAMPAPQPAPTATPAMQAPVPAPAPVGPQGARVASIDQDSDSCIVVRFTEEVVAPPNLELQFEGPGGLILLNHPTDEQGKTTALELRFGKYEGADNIARGTTITSFLFWVWGGLFTDRDGDDVLSTFEPYTVPADISCAVTR